MTNFFNNEEEYTSFVQKIPNFEQKPERARQAKNAWKSHIKIDENMKEKLKYA